MSTTLDMTRLLMREDQQKVSSLLTKIGSGSQDVSAEIQSLLPDHTQAIMITNKQINNAATEGYFVLEISRKGMQLLEQKSTQRLLYRFAFLDRAMTLNDRAVDQSFLHPFLLKIDQIAGQLVSGKALGYTKPREVIHG